MSGSIGTTDPIDLYQMYSAKETTYATNALQTNPLNQQLVAYFNTNAASITSPAQLLGNYKMLSVVLTAFNMQDKIGQTAVLQQLMTQNPSDPKSLAQTLGNTQALLFAKAMSSWTSPPFASASARAQLVQSFTTNAFETQADKQNSGMANALLFTREMPQLTSVTAVMADQNLLKVAVSATGITYDEYVQLDYTQQTALITKALKPSQFSNPQYVKQLAEQYLIQQNSSGGGAAAPPAAGSLASLFDDSGSDSDDGDAVLGILNPDANVGDSGSNGNGSVVSLFA